MNKDKRAIIYALSMFDGSVWMYADGKNCRMGTTHCAAQLPYLEWKVKRLTNAIGGKKITIHERVRDGVYEYYFKKCFPYLKQVHRNLYFNNRKRTFTRKTLDFLNEEAIAIWFMDDGTTQANRNADGWITSTYTYLATYCSAEEIEIMITYFKERWGITPKRVQPRTTKDGRKVFSLGFNTTESRKLAHLVAPTVCKIPCMMYKLQYFANLKFHERNAP